LRVTFVNAMSETLPHRGRRVSLSAMRKDGLGRPVPILHLAASAHDRRTAEAMNSTCVKVAEAICMPGSELYPLRGPEHGSTLFHEAGTCGMGGGDPPCDAMGRLRAADNLWVADASVFPSAGDRHPTLTVLAHTLRVARSMRRHLELGGVITHGIRGGR
jgi:choline dehydrogenase-like flavoprotein